MEYNLIKGKKVSKIGFGTWPLAGSVMSSYGTTNDLDSEKALNRAYELGINFYDTADFYGYGHVETLLGKVFNNKRNGIVIATKGGMVSESGEQNFSKDYLYRSLIKSLKRLNTDYIDFYLLHSPKLQMLSDGFVLECLEEFKSKGLISEYGISLISPQDGFDAILKYNFKIIEINYNLLDRRAETSGLFDLCIKNNVSTIIRTPLFQGLLTENFEFNDDERDLRNKWNKNKTTFLKESFNKLLSIINKDNLSKVQIALKFCLSNKSVSSIIPGMITDKQVEENVNNNIFKPFSNEDINILLDEYHKLKL